MLIRRIARPLLSVAFIGQGVESLLNPKSAAEAAAPAVDGLQALPDSVARSLPADPQTFAQVTAAVQIGGGLLLATGKLPRVASAVLAGTRLPAQFRTEPLLGQHRSRAKRTVRRGGPRPWPRLGQHRGRTKRAVGQEGTQARRKAG